MPTPLWTHRLSANLGGLAFARESGHVLAWDLKNWLVLLGRQGRVQAQRRLATNVVIAAIAEDGSVIVDADDKGTITWRTPDLASRRQHGLDGRVTALALDALGRALAVADAAGRVHCFDADGQAPWPPITLPRPAHRLAFASTAPFLFATADIGLIACIDLAQQRTAWQEAPVVHLGDLAMAGNPVVAAVGCFSEGVRRYGLTGRGLPPIATPEACRFVAATFAGDRLLVGGVFGSLHLLTVDGSIVAAEKMEQPVAGLALTPLGDTAIVASADGRIIGMSF